MGVSNCIMLENVSQQRYNNENIITGCDKMILYHGSEQIIKKPEYGKGSSTNDYGRGFYCTENKELGKEWACKKNKDGFVNQYAFDLDGLEILNLNDKSYSILHWLALLTKYRGYWQAKSIAEEAKIYLQETFLLDITRYDVIIGYRADDSYFSFAQDFISGVISLQHLKQAMYLGKLGEQIVLKSPKAFEQISYMGNEEAMAEEYFVKKCGRDLAARREYAKQKKRMDPRQEIYMIDILRGTVSEDDLRI